VIAEWALWQGLSRMCVVGAVLRILKCGTGIPTLRGKTMGTTDTTATWRSFGNGTGLRKKLMTLAASMMLATSAHAATPPTSEVNTTGLAVTDDTVKVGILHSITGTMAISEIGSVQAEKLAIEQINASGGVLGRQIEFVQEDGASDWPTFAEKSRKLLRQDNVAAIFGAWTSASRKAILPVIEQFNGMLYYPTFYEGLEQSPNVIYTGQEATQQILASIDWAVEEKGAKTFYLLGSDYIWPRTSNKIARKHIDKLGLKVVGEEYYPLGHTQFNSVINKQMKAAGIDFTKESPLLLTISVTEDEIRGIGGENVEGIYASMKYFQSLDNPNNQEFVAAFKEAWGDDMVIGDVTQAAYLGPWLWKMAVEKAGSFDVDKVREASPGIEFTKAPEGYVRIHENHHLWSKTRIGNAQRNGQYKVVYETEDLMEPDPFPEGYQ
jgi:urea transport system substrate-binding protein